jgi:hypothetical protein
VRSGVTTVIFAKRKYQAQLPLLAPGIKRYTLAGLQILEGITQRCVLNPSTVGSREGALEVNDGQKLN